MARVSIALVRNSAGVAARRRAPRSSARVDERGPGLERAERKTIDLRPSAGGKLPLFGGQGAYVHDRVRQEMVRVYRSAETPEFLDARAAQLLAEGRENFASLSLSTRGVLARGRETLLFPWRGDRVLNTLVRLFETEGVKAARSGVSITLDTTETELRGLTRRIVEEASINPIALAEAVENKDTNKYDRYLPASLQTRDYASRELDAHGALSVLEVLVDAYGSS